VRSRASRKPRPGAPRPKVVQRVQTGIRIERGILKVLKALAEYHDISLGDLVEGIVLHAFDGKRAFGKAGLERIGELKRIYGLRLNASDSHHLVEARGTMRPPRPRGLGSPPRRPRSKRS
jgi:hypothetical protein